MTQQLDISKQEAADIIAEQKDQRNKGIRVKETKITSLPLTGFHKDQNRNSDKIYQNLYQEAEEAGTSNHNNFQDNDALWDILNLERQGWLLNLIWKNYGSNAVGQGLLRYVFSARTDKVSSAADEINRLLGNIVPTPDQTNRDFSGRVFGIEDYSRLNDLMKESGKSKQKALKGATSLQLAGLYPKINLFAQYEENGKRTNVPFKFSSYGSSAAEAGKLMKLLFSSQDLSGLGGLQSVIITDNSENPEDVNLTADMTFFFRNLNAFLDSDSYPEDSAPYVDILYPFVTIKGEQSKKREPASISGQVTEDRQPNSSKEFVGIVAEVGWSIDESGLAEFGSSDEQQAVKNILVQSTRRYLFNLFKHDLDFREDGSLLITATFIGRDLGIFGNSDMNIFGLADKKLSTEDTTSTKAISLIQESKKSLIEKRNKLNPEKDKDKIAEIDENMKNLDNSINALTANLMDEQRRKIINNLLENYGMWKVLLRFPPSNPNALDDLAGKYNFDLFLLSQGGDVAIEGGDIAAQVADAEKKDKASSEAPVHGSEESVFFFTYIELLRAAYVTFGESLSKSDKNAMKSLLPLIVLGKSEEPFLVGKSLAIERAKPIRDRRCTNLAEVPIELGTFNSWMINEFVRKGRLNISFADFLQESFKTLLPNVLNNAVRAEVSVERPIFSISSSRFSSKKVAESEKLVKEGNGIIPARFMIELKQEQKEPINENDRLVPFLFIYGISPESVVPQDSVNSEEKDNENDIVHVYYGSQTGLIKKIKFSRIDLVGQAESIMVGSRARVSEEETKLLRNVFACSLTMVGNNIFFPGDRFAINPLLFGVSSNRDPGFFGYYKVIKVRHIFQDGKFETEVNANFEEIYNRKKNS